jgi:3D (Asp-Asp-Asp) domain-containing protein
MNRSIVALGAMLLCTTALATPARFGPASGFNALPSSRPKVVDAPSPRGGTSALARVTVYWAGGGRGSDRWTRKHQAATSVRLRVGHCAVDPRRIPYGSRILLPDATLVAVDTGRHVVSRKAARQSGRTPSERSALVIDRFFETKGQALAWAQVHPLFMTVRILAPSARPELLPAPRITLADVPRAQAVAYQRPPQVRRAFPSGYSASR